MQNRSLSKDLRRRAIVYEFVRKVARNYIPALSKRVTLDLFTNLPACTNLAAAAQTITPILTNISIHCDHHIITMALRPPSFRPSRLTCLSPLSKSFSTTPIAHHKSSKQRLAQIHAEIPEYPYGPSLWYKQSNFGLYGSQKIRSGNNVSKDSETKTRRKWRPNVQNRSLFSHALSEFIQVKVTTRVLRTIDKCGGLDEYLVGEKTGRIKELGMKGWELRWRVMNSPWWKNRCKDDLQKMGMGELIGEIEKLKRAAYLPASQVTTPPLEGNQGTVPEEIVKSTEDSARISQ
jgi:ribosomal protein L28